jgi:AAA+ superfamily predicted ATPase
MTDASTSDAGHRMASAAIELLVAEADIPEDTAALDVARAAVREATVAFDESIADSAVAALVAGAALTALESRALVLCIEAERDERLQRLLAHVHADRDRNRWEVATLARALSDAGAALVVGPDSGLRRAALIEVVGGQTWSRQTVSVSPTVMWALAGDPLPDADLPVGALVHEVEPADGPRSPWVLVTGRDRVRRRVAGMRRASASRCLVCAAPDDDRAWAAIVREATLVGAGVVVEVGTELSLVGRRWIDRARHLVWVLSSAHTLDLDLLPVRDWSEISADDGVPTDEEWFDAFGTTERRHALTVEQLEMVKRNLGVVGGDVDAAVRRLVSSKLEELARRIRPSRGWNDLVLPPGHLRQLRELVARYHGADKVYGDWGFPAVPSRGLVALFSGPSGTGKTLAAEVIAGELGLDLFKLNLSSVVSKYIGETEKNLDQLFEAAGAGNLVLFFDEADALFGRRSEVKDARDRYANLETSYLLQRLEEYDGVVVMATNFEKNIDDAFLRRIHTRVDFATPSAAERAAIWRHHLTHEAPLVDIDVDELARRFDLTGGSIRNASIHAAFLAATEGTGITMETVVRGLGREYRKLGRLLKSDDFGPWYPLVDGELRQT